MAVSYVLHGAPYRQVQTAVHLTFIAKYDNLKLFLCSKHATLPFPHHFTSPQPQFRLNLEATFTHRSLPDVENLSVHSALQQYVDVDPNSEPSRQSYVKFVEGKSPDEVRWWSKDTVAVVTGANKGIGFEIVRQLAEEGVNTILTARDENRGVAAVDRLKGQGLENVLFHPLEVTDPASAATLASWIKEKFGGFDILVNNAGTSSLNMIQGHESAKIIIGTNYGGSKIVTSALLPLLKPSRAGARIIFVSSEMGQLQYLGNEKVKQQLNDLDHLTEEVVDSLRVEYLENVKNGEDNWTVGFAQQYKMSKVLLNAYSRALAKSLSSRPSGTTVYVNVMSPGLTTTDLSNNVPGGRTAENAADTAVWLALFPSGGPNGEFLRDRADYPY